MKKRLYEIIKAKGLVFSKTHKIVLTNGRNGEWLFDIRSVFLDPEGLDILGQLFWDEFETKLPFQVGGLEVGAIPFIAAIQLEGRKRGYNINGFIIRKERRNVGLCRSVEGIITDEKIVIVDDLMNSGNSQRSVQAKLKSEGGKISGLYVVVDFKNNNGKKFCEEEGVEFHSLFSIEDFGIKKSRAVPQKRSVVQLNWTFCPPNPNYFFVVPKSTPVLDDEKLYYGTDSGIFYALHQKTGKVMWQYQTGNKEKGIFSSPSIIGDLIIFGGYDGNCYALNKESGDVIWEFTEADFIGSSPAIASDLNMVFIGLEHQVPGKKGSVVALDVDSGNKKWDFVVSEYLHGTPAYLASKKVVAIGTNDSIVYLFKAETGRLLWEFQTGGQIKASLCFDEKRNTVIFGSFDGNCYGVDVDSGEEVFRVKTDNQVYSTPLVVGDNLYVTSTDKYFYNFDLDKEVISKKIRTNGKILSSPRLIDGGIYFGANDGIVRAYDLVDQKITLAAQFPERITGSIVKSDRYDIFYATAYDNQVFAFSEV